MKDRALLTEFAACTVLVIDDNITNVELLTALLLKAGLTHIVGETDPRVAVAQLASIDPDLVLVDLHMPEMDGLDVLDRVVAYAAGYYLPVLLLTADTTRDAAHAALARGADDFLTKPFFTTEVLLRVQTLLRTRMLYRTLRQQHVALEDELRDIHAHAAVVAESADAIRHRIRAVVAADDLRVAVQPIVELHGGGIVGFEGLARFADAADRGSESWFDDAQLVGLGLELERHALAATLRVRAELPETPFLAVNCSPTALRDGDVRWMLDPKHNQNLVLELTEHVPVEDYRAMHRLLEPLRDEGLQLAVDDTGAGYAGLRHLLSLAPDIIKLDISLIHRIDSDLARRALTSALVTFAADVGSRLVAEGIETTGELETLRELGVEWGQGFVLGRPGPVAAYATA